jgi:hypothetical protein
MKDGYLKFISEVEKTYPCLGITCEDVGVYMSSGVAKGGMKKCSDDGSTAPATSAGTSAPVTDESGALGAAFAMVLLNVYT